MLFTMQGKCIVMYISVQFIVQFRVKYLDILSLAFQVGTAKNFSFTVGTPELQIYTSLHGTMYSDSFFLFIYCHNFQAVRYFDLIPTLRARPKYQLSYGTKCPDKLPLYLVGLRFLSQCQSGYSPNAIKRQKNLKNCCFWPLQTISAGQVCYKLPKLHY